jgi:hypothetical protein
MEILVSLNDQQKPRTQTELQLKYFKMLCCLPPLLLFTLELFYTFINNLAINWPLMLVTYFVT